MVGIDTLLASIDVKLNIEPHPLSECCIYRVPDSLRTVNKDAFIPQMVSIGPFHHRKCERVKAMDGHKVQYLKAMLHRGQNLELKNYLNTLMGLEQRARSCYAEPINLTSDEFVEMMLLDGCFIVELFLRHWDSNLITGYDPLFHTFHIQNALDNDLILLENQLPFFVLNDLFNLNSIAVGGSWTFCFLDLAFEYFKDDLKMVRQEGNHYPFEPKHLLDLVLQKYVPSPNMKKKGDARNQVFKLIPRATHLWEAGIKFKPAQDKRLLDINFAEGVLEIPIIEVGDQTEPLLRNLIAFEQCYSKSTYVSDYTTLMDNLIDSSSDVALLRRKDVVINWLGDDEEVSLIFNKLGKHVVATRDFHYTELYEQLNRYYKAPWHKWQAKLKRDYFNTPWSTISFVAAVVLLVCTVLQTVYTITG